jgi:hypothetical protein
MAATHRIRRQRWQVVAPSQAAAFAARQYLRQTQEADLLPVLEAAFEAAAGGETVLRIPRLDLKVHVSSADRLAEELPRLLAEAASCALAGGASASPGSSTRAWMRSAADPEPALSHYLSAGQVDWFDAHRASEDLQRELAAEAVRWSQAPAVALQRLAELPSVRLDIALFRLLQLLPAGELAHWADHVRVAAAADEAPWLDDLITWQASATRDLALRLLVLAILLIDAAPTADAPLARPLEGAAAAVAAALMTLPTVDRKKWARIENRIAEVRALSGVSRSEGAGSPVLGRPDRTGAARQEFQISPNFPVDRQAAPGLPVFGAGLVLLHPWLPRLFAALGWVAERHPSGEPFPWARLPQALSLSHWLATGRDEPPEFELGTAKLLLGLAPDAPLPVAGGLLDDAARREGLALLEAVIGHWSALGHTSVDGFRVAFLQRAGLLQAEDDHWLLRPHSESYDLLLSRLRWGIGLIRLPWMPQRLHIEWTTP